MPEGMNRLIRAYDRRRILGTGSASVIGNHPSELLVESGAKVTVTDDFSSGIEKQLVKPAVVKSRAANVGKCREKLNRVSAYSIREGIERSTNWYLDAFERRDTATIERLLIEQN